MKVILSGIKPEYLDACLQEAQKAAVACNALTEISYITDDYGEVRVRVELQQNEMPKAETYAQVFGIAVAEAVAHGRTVACLALAPDGNLRASWRRW